FTLEKTRFPAVARQPPANAPAPPPAARHRSLRAIGSQAYRTFPVGPSGPIVGSGGASAAAGAGLAPPAARAAATSAGTSAFGAPVGAGGGFPAPPPAPPRTPPPAPAPVPMFMRPRPVGPISVGAGV